MLLLRKLHLYVGFALVPLVLLQAVTGLLLRVRVSSAFLHTVHTWFKYRVDLVHMAKTIGPIVGIVTAAGLTFLAVSGATVYISMRIQQWRRRARRRGGAGPQARP